MATVSSQLKEFLDRKVDEYNQPSFILNDPICVPHLFSRREDIEIAGFFAAIFSWGKRNTIINKSKELMLWMDNAPYDFCTHHSDKELQKLLTFRHRTFNATDLLYFVEFFKMHYSNNNTLETAFSNWIQKDAESIENGLNGFYNYFFSLPDVPRRTVKHIACPAKKSTCKRLNMYLRWMVRKDNNGVDFGLWEKISPSQLIIPIDVHVARVARQFKLLQRKQSDWEAALALTRELKKLDPLDPVKYDFALFALGIIEKF